MAAAACGTQATAAASHPSPAAKASSAVVFGPRAPDAACQAAVRAQRALQTSQVRDKTNEKALDADFITFANALNADAGHESDAAAAQAMTKLASDYSDLVQSQSGNAQLPDIATIQSDGTAFNHACGA